MIATKEILYRAIDHDRMHRLNHFYFISLLFCASAALLAAVSNAASPAPTNPPYYGQAGTASYLVTNSAKDAAVAMNSIGFISHLASYKESDDIKSYRQLMNPQPSSLYSHMTTHETVTEYKAKKIWFLPSMRDGVRFRETIRVISISADGKLSTVECTTQYHNGSRWVDCARVLCKFTSDVLDSKVKMSLENEVLVWLPLPKIAIRAVGKKILTVFEQAALDFFYQ